MKLSRIYIIAGVIALGGLYDFQLSVAQNTLVGKQLKLQNVAVSHNGQNLVLNMDVNMDSLHMSSNNFVVFTPYIISKSNVDSCKFIPIMINGRKQHVMFQRGNRKQNYPNVIEVKRTGKSQTLHYFASVAYEPWMKAYRLDIAEDLCGCGNILDENTSTLTSHSDVPPSLPLLTVMPKSELKKQRNMEGKAYLDFPVNQLVIYPDYRNNPKELSKIIETISPLYKDKNITLNSVSVHGYASPEGPYSNNARLAKGRAWALMNYVKKLFEFKDNQLTTVNSTPEDWEGLDNYIKNSSYAEKQTLHDMINSNDEPDVKEAKIKKSYPTIYGDLLQNVYPGLRHSDYTITYTVRPFSIEELKDEYKKNPANLSAEEMYKLAEEVGLETKEGMNILETAAYLNPNIPTANLNAAQVALYNKDLSSAESFVEKAGDSAEAFYTKGAIMMAKGDLDSAEKLFIQSKKLGLKEADDALILIYQYK